MIHLTIPYRLPSAPNLREHWAVKARRVKQQRGVVTMFLGARPRPPLPTVVTLTRIAPRPLDGDNLAGAFKAMRDAVAEWLGVDDADPRVTWAYAQRREGVKRYAVEVCIGGGA